MVIGTANITAQDQRFDDYIVTEKGLYFNPKRIPEASKKIAQHIKDHKKISWMFFFLLNCTKPPTNKRTSLSKNQR